jgi:hypothetical protein
MTSSIEFGSIETNTTSSIELGSSSTVQIQNLSFVDEVLIASLYGDDPLIAVPWLQLISSLAQATSLLILMTVLLRERRRAKGRAHKDAWVQLDQAATPSRSDAVLKAFLLVSAVAFAFSATVLLLLCSPIVHVGTFAGAVYVGQGVVDMLPLLWSLQAEPAFGAPTALRAALVLGAVAIVRVVAVAGRPPLMAFTPGASVRRAAAFAQPTSRRASPLHPHTSLPPPSHLSPPPSLTPVRRASTSSRRATTQCTSSSAPRPPSCYSTARAACATPALAGRLSTRVGGRRAAGLPSSPSRTPPTPSVSSCSPPRVSPMSSCSASNGRACSSTPYSSPRRSTTPTCRRHATAASRRCIAGLCSPSGARSAQGETEEEEEEEEEEVEEEVEEEGVEEEVEEVVEDRSSWRRPVRCRAVARCSRRRCRACASWGRRSCCCTKSWGRAASLRSSARRGGPRRGGRACGRWR